VTGINRQDAPGEAGATLPEPAEGAPRVETSVFNETEQQQLEMLNGALVSAYAGDGGDEAHRQALRCYLQTMPVLGERYRMFEIANHRIFKCDGTLIVPYKALGNLSIHILQTNGEHRIVSRRLQHGAIITDNMVADVAGVQGEVIDLEREIYQLDVEGMPVIQISRLRDLANVLERLNRCGSRHEAVYLLRFIVARLCSASQPGLPGAKNLQTEIARVRRELAALLNGPFAARLRLPLRVLVRSISDLVSRPKIIDEVWQDTIDLSEVYVRGSAIANEIRRSTHHALGKRTLKLARAYLQWLETGEAEFPDPARERPGPQDQAAREDPGVRALTGRIVDNLQHLMGSAQISERITEWRQEYADELVRCDSSGTMAEELEALVENGIHAANRWIYQHRLRNLVSKAKSGRWPPGARESFEASLERLQNKLPGADGFDPGQTESAVREAVSRFTAHIRSAHQDALFGSLDELLKLYQGGHYREAFETGSKLRHALSTVAGDGVFPSQNYLLHQLDCLLEEMGYLALRHVASGYEEQQVAIEECLGIVHICAGNLERNGLFCRELWDLSAMLVDVWRTPPQMVEVLESIQRQYHRLVHRVSVAYEVMAEELGYGPDEMRAVLANFQRTMHDLNSLVHFADLARKRLTRGDPEFHWTGAKRKAEDPWDFVHLSHLDDIDKRVRNWTVRSLQDRYGGKGSGLMYLSFLGIPTRDGFIIPTTLPRLGLHRSERTRLKTELLHHVRVLETDIARNEGTPVRLGDPDSPLLLAVRGGSLFSMPGILETVVFVGMTDAVASALATEDEWYAWDAYRRFLASYADAAWGLNLEKLDLIEKAKRRHGVELKTDLPGEAMRDVVESSKAAIRAAGHADELEAILADPELQLHSALRAVHGSWDRERARRFRAIKHISEGWHTAAIVQQMASGNRSNPELTTGMDETQISLTGVIPSTLMQSTGFRAFTGDVKFSACGDDLVGGLTTVKSFEPVQKLRTLAPMLDRRLNHIGARLRRYRGTDAEIEFTVERGVLSVLQARSAQPEEHSSARTFDNPGTEAAHGIGIRGGAFRGKVAFNDADVKRLSAELSRQENDDVDGVLLLLENPIPDEIPLILSADALLTAKGGSTSHAAVVVHGIEDKPFSAVLGVASLSVSKDQAVLLDSSDKPAHNIQAGDVLSIHGKSGAVFVGSRKVLDMGPVTGS
jgi:phosphohistidine swiveling domain-containing protein